VAALAAEDATLRAHGVTIKAAAASASVSALGLPDKVAPLIKALMGGATVTPPPLAPL
jgi:hypothetical protein